MQATLFCDLLGMVSEPENQVAQKARGRNGNSEAKTRGVGRWRRGLQ